MTKTQSTLRSLLATLCMLVVSTSALAAIDFSGVRALADRMGKEALTSKLSFEEIADKSVEKAQIVPVDADRFKIRATSVHAASLAMGVYLRDVAKGHISWCGKRMPTEWAVPTTTIDVQARYPMAMAYNYCTLSYTMAYWSKEAWQNEIDRLALSGYNTALCMAGVQKIWKLTMEELGYTTKQREDFIVDDAQQAWWLMGNLQAIGNGTEEGHYPVVSDEEIEKDAEIGKFIVKQMRAVGIEPVLQGFIGLVPSTTTKDQLVTYLNNHSQVCTDYGITDPTADESVHIFVNGNYNEGHKNPDLIDPNCKIFQVFSDVWNKNLKAVYGMESAADYPKYLGGDLFHESSPPKSLSYQEQVNCAAYIQKYQLEAFPGVTWVLQNWQSAPVQNLRDGLDPEHTIIQRLDQTMSATDARTASYVNNTTGKSIPWVWVEVMNFGGNTGMHGAFRRFRNVGNLGGNASFKGYGLLSEGLETNPISYDMYHWAMAQTTAAAQNIADSALAPWMAAYRERRYGYTDGNLEAAYKIFADTVWTCTRDQQGTIESVFCAKPGYNVTKVSEWGPTTGTPYDPKKLVEAARYMLTAAKAKPELLDLETFRYDFVEVFQQILADKARVILPDCEQSKARRDDFRKMLELVDQILACSNEWRLDAKEDRLKGKAPETGPAAYRRMITTWTPGKRHKTQLSNYAHRSYAGLIKNYSAVKWNAYFDITEGEKTLQDYNKISDDLDENFPTMDLTEEDKATPAVETLDPIAIAEEILVLVDPPAYTWNGAAGNGTWDDGVNWIFNSFPAAWANGNNAVVTTDSSLSIGANGAVSIQNLEVKKGEPSQFTDVAGADSTTVIKTTPVTVFTNKNLADLANWQFFAKMGGGGWFDSRVCAATAYGVKAVKDGDGNVTAVTAQFQSIDGTWLKVLNVKFTQSGDDIVAVATQAYGWNNGKLGTLLAGNSGTNPEIDNYPLYGITAKDPVPTSLTLDAKIKVAGELLIEDTLKVEAGDQIAGAESIQFAGGALDLSQLSGALTLSSVTLDGDSSIVVPNGLTLTLDEVKVKKGTLTIKGENDTLASGQIFVPRAAVKSLIYVGSDGVEQTLNMTKDGSVRTPFGMMTYDSFVTATATKTTWSNVTLDDLATCEFTGCMTGGYFGNKENNVVVSYRHVASRGAQIDKAETSLTVQMQCVDDGWLKAVPLTFTIGADGYVYVQAATGGAKSGGTFGTSVTGTTPLANAENNGGYGIHELVVKPAVAQVADTKANYAAINDAVTAAKSTTSKALSVIADTTYSAARGLTGGVKLTIEPGVCLTSTVGDGTDWGGTSEVIVKGILDLANTRWTFSNNNTLTLYTGCEVIGTGDGKNNGSVVEIHGNEHTIAVHKGAGEKAKVSATIGLSDSVIFDVDEDAVCEIAKTSGGNNAGADRTITKTGLGELILSGTIYARATVKTGDSASGTLTRSFAKNETLAVTKGAGEVAFNMIPPNEDCKVDETINGAVHTFTCVEKAYRYRVTDPGYISVNMPGKEYETLAEALAAAEALQKANPSQVVMIWASSQEVESLVLEDIAAYNAANGTNFELHGDGAGIELRGWYQPEEEEPVEPEEPFAAVKAIIGRLAGGYNGASAEGLDAAKAETAMAKFEFVQVADTVVAKGAAKVDNNNGKIRIQASDASGASYGLGQYLRHTAKMHISWCGNRVTDVFPLPTGEATYTPAIPVRFAYNYCTLSYTMAFWSAKEWREEIDRLALSGYNVALVLQGLQEAWRITLESVKKANGSRVYSDEQIMKYVSDEAAQAWWHMGNLEGLGGPLGSDKGQYSADGAYARFTARTKADAVLGEYIYAEMMKLGIQPSIQSFVGLVPDCSNQVLADGVSSTGVRFGSSPNWGIINEGGWQGYTRPDVVNPLNIAFDEMSKAWYGALVSIYKPAENGYTAYMGGDLFHEGGNKGSLTDTDLANIAVKIQNTQNAYFGKNGNVVTWVLQSWQGSPYQGIRNGLDISKAIIQLLDKDMSTTGGVNADYWKNADGTSTHIPWIWVEVLNFGGNTGMHGGARRFRNLAKIGTNGDKDNANTHAGSFKGYGILSEGLETNPMMYDMFNDAFSRTVGPSTSIDDKEINQWVSDYCERRYGLVDDNLKSAYSVLLRTVFDCSRYQEGCVENMLCAPPDAAVSAVSKWGPKGGIEYDPAELYPAAYLFLDVAKAHPELLELETFRYDFVELFLQLLGERGRVINADIVTPGAKRNLFIKLLDLAERLTASSNRWRLDWHEARTQTVCPGNEGIRGYRRMITCWADGYAAGQATGLREYAHRAYAGLIKDYYAKRWFAWFDKLDGKITQAQYTAFLSALDDSIMTAELEPTQAGDLVKLGEEILETLNPPALTLDATTDAVDWTTSEWTDAKGQTSAWIDDYDVNLSGVCTISASSAVNVGSLTIGPSKRSDVAIYSGYLPVGAANAVKLFSNMTAEDRENVAYFRGTMNGGWVAQGEAKSYQMNDGPEYLEMQMQRIDDGYLKSVRVRTYYNPADGCIWGYAVNAGNINGGVLGANVTGTGTTVATSDSMNGYGIKEFAAILNSDIKLTGAIKVSGALTVSGGKLTLTTAAQATAPSEIKIENGTLILDTTVGTAALKNVTIGADGKLLIKGDASALSAITFTGSVLPKGEIVLVNGTEEIPLEVLSNGTLKVKLAAQTFDGAIGAWTDLGWKNLTLDDLVVCEFISGGVRATNVVKSTDSVDLMIGSSSVKLAVKSDGQVQAYASPAITGLKLNPAVARVDDIGANYADFTSAWNDANTNGKKVTVIADCAYTGAQKSLGGGYTLTIAFGATLTFTMSDQINYDGTLTLNVYGTIVIDGIHQSFGTNNTINLYAGAKVLGGGDSEGGLSVFGTNGRISCFKNGDQGGEIYIEPSVVVRHNNVIWVAEGVTVTHKGGLVKAGWETNTQRSITKTGAGTYVLVSPVSAENLSVILSAGTFAHALEPEETFSLTVMGGIAEITSADADFEVVEPAAPLANVHTWKSQGIVWLYLVTDPGETAQNGPGVKFKHFEEAYTYALQLRRDHPGQTVKLWGMVANETIVKAELAEVGPQMGLTLDVVIAPAGMEVIGWDEPVRYYYTSSDTEWTKSTVVTAKRGTSETDYVVQPGDIVMFDKDYAGSATVTQDGAFGPITIHGSEGDANKVVCTEIEVVKGTTLWVAFDANGAVSIPEDWTINVQEGATVAFNNTSASENVVKVPLAHFNGKGSVTFDAGIASADSVVFGEITGDTVITIPSGVTVTQVDATSTIENPLAGSGKLIVTNVNFAYTLAEDSAVQIESGVAGYRPVTNGNIVTFEEDIVRVWRQGSGAAISTESANPTVLLSGLTIEELLTSGKYELRAALGGSWMSSELLSHAVVVTEPESGWRIAQFQIKDKDGSGNPILKFANVKFAVWDRTIIKGCQVDQGFINGWEKLGTFITTKSSAKQPDNTQYQIKSFAAAIHHEVTGVVAWDKCPEEIIPEDIVVIGHSGELTLNFALENHIEGDGALITTVEPSAALKGGLTSEGWTGTFTLSGMNDTASVKPINPSNYGNAKSVVELKNCANAYFNADGSSDVELKVTGTLAITDGYGNRTFTLAKLSGDGTITLNKHLDAGAHTIKVLDASAWTGTITEVAANNSVKIVFAVAKVGDQVFFSVEEAAAAAGPTDTLEILRAEPGMVITVTNPNQKIKVPSGFTGNFTLNTTESGLWYKTADLPGDGTSILFFQPGTDTAFDKIWTNIYLGPTMVPTATGDWNISTDWAKKSGKILLRNSNGLIPYVAGDGRYQSALFDGENLRNVLKAGDGRKHVAVTQVLDGWNTNLAAVHNVAVEITKFSKLQSDSNPKTQFYVDETSKITVGAVVGDNGTSAEYHVAAEEGLVLPRTMSNLVEYYLSGNGSVKYTGNFNNGSHTIKTADIEIGSGNYKVIRSKMLIALKSDATNTKKDEVVLANDAVITADTGIATTKKDSDVTDTDDVGTYSLRADSDGVYLDYVGRATEQPRVQCFWGNKAWNVMSKAADSEGNKNKALDKSGATIDIDAEYDLIFDKDHWDESKVLYIKDIEVIPHEIRVKAGTTLKIGFSTAQGRNIPAKARFYIEEGAQVLLVYWGNGNRGTNAVIGDGAVIDGPGKLIITSDVNGITTNDALIEAVVDSNVTGKVAALDKDGNVTLVAGGVYPVENETIVLKIPATTITTLGGDAALETKGANELKVWESYVLGLDKNVATSLPTVAATQSNDPDTFKLTDLNVAINKTAGVKVTPKLFEGTPGSTFTEVTDDSAQVEGAGFVIKVPTGDTKVKYYKIKYEIK